MADNIISQILYRKPPDTLFHYTSATGLFGVLESGNIWATKIQYLNDNSELQLAFDYIRAEIRRQRKGVGKTRDKDFTDMLFTLDTTANTNVGVASFTEMGDQLSQWRGYCEIGKGYSIGFNGAKLDKVATKNKCLLAPCIYEEDIHLRLVKVLIDNYPLLKEQSDEKKQIPNYPSFITGFATEALIIAPLIKAKGFQEEREWRFITDTLGYGDAKFRQGNHSIIPYWEFDLNIMNTLKAIIIGPTPEPFLSIRALEGLLIKKKFQLFMKTTVSQSKIPFRKI